MGSRGGVARGSDWVKDAYYANHLKGTSYAFSGDRSRSRLAIIERLLVRTLTEMAANRFEWTGLPKEINVRFMEMTLLRTALAVFFKAPDAFKTDNPYGDKYFALRGGGSGMLNMYDDPTSFTVIGSNFAGRQISIADCVPIWSNYMRIPDYDIIYVYAQKLAEIDLTIEINSKNARRGKIVSVDENRRLTAANYVNQIDAGEPVIYTTVNPMGEGAISTIDLGVDPDTIINLHILRTRLWSECMGLLGINNANQDKKERLVADEVDANNEQVSAMRAVNLNSRQQAAERISDKYDIELTVDFRKEGPGPGGIL
jgi:hypothetical protein